MKVWRNPEWYYRPERHGWSLSEAGECEIGEVGKTRIELTAEEVRMLIVALDEEGWIKPRLDERLRVEDLKITHRLLDIIEGKVK